MDVTKILANKLDLFLNVKKSVYIVFSRNKKVREWHYSMYLGNDLLTQVDKYKYLGILLTSDLKNKLDIERCENSFLRQFFCIFRKFNFTEPKILLFLFQSHCTSFYGSDTWDDLTGSIGAFDSLETNYHNCLKLVLKNQSVPAITSFARKTDYLLLSILLI